MIPRRVPRRRRDDVPTFGTNIQAFTNKPSARLDGISWVPEVEVFSSPGDGRQGVGELAMLLHQSFQRRLALRTIDIQHEQIGTLTGGDANIRVWPGFPPPQFSVLVRCAGLLLPLV